MLGLQLLLIINRKETNRSIRLSVFKFLKFLYNSIEYYLRKDIVDKNTSFHTIGKNTDILGNIFEAFFMLALYNSLYNVIRVCLKSLN